jgi:hypothetical protein
MDDASLRIVRFHVDRGRHSYRNRALGCYGAALVVLGITAAVAGAEFYRQGPMVLVGILGLAGVGFHLWYRTLSWSRHPVLIALASAPETIERAAVATAVGRARRLDERQVVISAGDASVMLTVKVTDLAGLGEALRAHCPDIELSGFATTTEG